MALEDYRRKRSFNRTPEPGGGEAMPAGQRPIFVVQLHHASHRHYDFRLQVGGVLRSWAVPKGPSLDPSVKRMAVQVEDHPLGYAQFEGEIPHDQYGGGHVALFDRGIWTTDGDVEAQLAKGHLRFELHGQRLKGGWHLVRSGKPARQPQWLLFKDDDAWAGPQEADDLLDGVTPAPAVDVKRARRPGANKTAATPAPRKPHATRKRQSRDWAALAAALPGARRRALARETPAPQLARLVARAPAGEDWLHEIKWDGYRLIACVRDGVVSLYSRNALDWTAKLPEIAGAIALLGLRDALLDGELVAGGGSREDFNLLQGVLSGQRQGALRHVLFDVMHLDGIDLARSPLLARKQLLEQLLADPPPHLAYSSHGIGHAQAAFEAAQAAGFEGIISKRVDAHYHAGRSDDWRKTKAQASAEFAVVGWTPPKGGRRGIGALLLATPDPEHGWRYAGRIGSGFSDAQLLALGQQLQRKGEPSPSVFVPDNDTDLRQARWFAPAFVVEAFVRGSGGSGLLRQASFKALRPDKRPADLRADPAHASEELQMGDDGKARPKPRKAAKKTRAKTAAARVPPTLSSPEKLLFPEDRISKRQVFDYYAAVMDWFLPEISGRPLSVIRCPAGIAQQCFFQKHATPGLELVSLAPLKEDSGIAADYIVATDAASVLELVQFNAIEFHPWGAMAATPEDCDRLVFDLDPDTGIGWSDIVAAAREVRDNLKKAGLESFVRTSGGKGLHVVVPLDPAVPWSEAKPFAEAFAKAMRDADPLRYVATASKAQRKGRIFIDWLRNGRGATSVASFSLRARAGAPVAMPLKWQELGRIKAGNAFHIGNAPARLKRWKAHPWGDYARLRQGLPRFD